LFAVTVLLLLLSSSSFKRRKWQSCGELVLFVFFFVWCEKLLRRFLMIEQICS
jgi:hypothetical protein